MNLDLEDLVNIQMWPLFPCVALAVYKMSDVTLSL